MQAPSLRSPAEDADGNEIGASRDRAERRVRAAVVTPRDLDDERAADHRDQHDSHAAAFTTRSPYGHHVAALETYRDGHYGVAEWPKC